MQLIARNGQPAISGHNVAELQFIGRLEASRGATLLATQSCLAGIMQSVPMCILYFEFCILNSVICILGFLSDSIAGGAFGPDWTA